MPQSVAPREGTDLELGRSRLVWDESEAFDIALQYLESGRADADELDAKAVILDPANGCQFDLDGSGLIKQRHGQLQIIPSGDSRIAGDRGAAQREVLDPPISADRVADERHDSIDGKSLELAVLHI
jgi:hypothetical protein